MKPRPRACHREPFWCARLLRSLSADARSANDVITPKGPGSGALPTSSSWGSSSSSASTASSSKKKGGGGFAPKKEGKIGKRGGAAGRSTVSRGAISGSSRSGGGGGGGGGGGKSGGGGLAWDDDDYHNDPTALDHWGDDDDHDYNAAGGDEFYYHQPGRTGKQPASSTTAAGTGQTSSSATVGPVFNGDGSASGRWRNEHSDRHAGSSDDEWEKVPTGSYADFIPSPTPARAHEGVGMTTAEEVEQLLDANQWEARFGPLIDDVLGARTYCSRCLHMGVTRLPQTRKRKSNPTCVVPCSWSWECPFEVERRIASG